MYRLMYVSTAAPNIHDSDIDELVARASVKNHEIGLTGALAYNGTNFAQVLEGDEFQVLALLETIRLDKRHDGVIVVGSRKVDSRAFGEWGMMRVEGLNFEPLISVMAS